MEMSRADLFEWTRWIKALEIPAGYDRDTLDAYSFENASDVEPARMLEVAQSTARMYIDDRAMAIESGVAVALPPTMREEAERLLLQSEHAGADLIRVREIPGLHRPAYIVHVKNHGERRGRAVFAVVPEFKPCAS